MVLIAFSSPAAERRYGLLLTEPPAVEQAGAGRTPGFSRAIRADVRARVAASQRSVRDAVARQGYRAASSDGTLVNAIFVRGPEGIEKQLAAIPGVQRVVRLKPYRRMLNLALNDANAARAWDLSGGVQNAGLGIRIGIIDTGIDPGHPGMQDGSLPPPAGGKRCTGPDCDYTNNKIVAARSYVIQLDRPDDFTPRDRAGHGTAVAMIAAGAQIPSPLGQISGVAPRAYLGNYKVFGSPGVNDATYSDVLTSALTDAFNDGMDVVTLSLGQPAEWYPNDACGTNQDRPCDPFGYAVYNAVGSGMAVVVPAGNDGEAGIYAPTFSTINTPGTVADAITVGSITNGHALYYGLNVTGDNVPPNLQRINSLLGNGPRLATPLTAPLLDVSKLGNDGTACAAMGSGVLNGGIAVLSTGGDCSFAAKVTNAQNAGAVGVVLINSVNNTVFPPLGLAETGIPLMVISKADGAVLQDFLASNPNRPGTFDLTLRESSAPPDIVSTFSSLGPSIVQGAIKPELVAPGEKIFTATQSYDPNGELYDPSGFTVVQGTSFAVPFVAGAVALVKQAHPDWSAAQLKSAVVNTANPDVGDTDDTSRTASVFAMGAGRLDAGAAVSTNVTVEPSVLSFGDIGSLPVSIQLTIRNTSNAPLSLTLKLNRRTQDNTTITITPTGLSIPANSAAQAAVAVSGALTTGSYEGFIQITGASQQLNIPFAYVVGDGVPDNAIPLSGQTFSALAGGLYGGDFDALTMKVIDRFGVPVRNIGITWDVVTGGGVFQTNSGPAGSLPSATDGYGISAASQVQMGPSPGEQVFRATVNGTTASLWYYGLARLPQIAGIADAATNQGGAVAPGSYISLYGAGLADAPAVFRTPYLPVSVSGVSVGFQVPGDNQAIVWAPGAIHFVSPGQVNVQVPWELAGQKSANLWLTVGGVWTATQEIKVQDAAPGGFAYTEPSTGKSLASALDLSYNLLGTANPARRGSIIQLYANGLGPLDHTPPTGEPAPGAEPLARLRVLPEVTIGGRPATVSFGGLAPYIVGLYQLNIQVPDDAPTGYQPVVLSVNGVASPPVTLYVQ